MLSDYNSLQSNLKQSFVQPRGVMGGDLQQQQQLQLQQQQEQQQLEQHPQIITAAEHEHERQLQNQNQAQAQQAQLAQAQQVQQPLALALPLDQQEKRGSHTQHHLAGLSCDAYGGPSQQVAQEMVYWEDIPTDNKWISPFKQSKVTQYLTFEPDGGGWYVYTYTYILTQRLT